MQNLTEEKETVLTINEKQLQHILHILLLDLVRENLNDVVAIECVINNLDYSGWPYATNYGATMDFTEQLAGKVTKAVKKQWKRIESALEQE